MSRGPFVNFTLTPASEKAIDRLVKVFSKKELLDGIYRFFQRVAGKAADFVRDNYLSGQLLKVRSGELRDSIEGLAIIKAGMPAVRVGVFRGPALRYANIQEHGGTIRPRNARALAVPPEGSPARGSGLGPRDYSGQLRFVPFRNSGIAVGALYDADELRSARQARGRSFSLRDVQAVYLLLTEVQIEGKHYLAKGAAQFLPYIGRELGKYLKDVARGKPSLSARP
jgi:hypothetical protein